MAELVGMRRIRLVKRLVTSVELQSKPDDLFLKISNLVGQVLFISRQIRRPHEELRLTKKGKVP